MNPIKNILILLILVLVVNGCGGGGTTDNDSQIDSPDQISLGNTLNYSTDIPASLEIISEGVASYTVNGLTAGSSYNFMISAASGELGMFAQDISAPTSRFCSVTTTSGGGSCTVAMLGTSAYITITNQTLNNVTFNLDITEVSSNNPGTINEGTLGTPIQLALNQDLPYDTSVAGFGGNSYYQVNGLVAGTRYYIEIANSTEDISLNVFSDDFTTDVKCDPDYSGLFRCLFVSDGTSASIHINNIYMNGTFFTLNVTEKSPASGFDGTWHLPVNLDLASTQLPYLGKVDGYNSYYKLNGLTVGKTYTVGVNSKDNEVSLKFFNSATGESVGVTCNPDYLSNFTLDDESCTFAATSIETFIKLRRATEDSSTANYIITLVEEPLSEGSIVSPVALSYASKIRYSASVGETDFSYYHISGLTPGTAYTVRLSGEDVLDQNVLTAYGSDATYASAISCDVNRPLYCILTAASSDLYIKVAPPTNPPGKNFFLNVTPTPIGEGDINMTPADFPHSGQVDSYGGSKYIISGLTPNTDYVTSLKDVTATISLMAWDNSSSVINDGFSTESSNACTVNSGPNGVINVRPDNPFSSPDPGGHFVVDIQLAGQLSMDYQDIGNTTIIPDNDPVGISRSITVNGSAVTSISNVTVEVNVEHDVINNMVMYLIAPDGTTVALIEHNGGGAEMINTQFNDYSTKSIATNHFNQYKLSYRPSTPLYKLNGMDANGIWTLKLADDIYINTSNSLGGKYHSWGISFQ